MRRLRIWSVLKSVLSVSPAGHKSETQVYFSVFCLCLWNSFTPFFFFLNRTDVYSKCFKIPLWRNTPPPPPPLLGRVGKEKRKKKPGNQLLFLLLLAVTLLPFWVRGPHRKKKERERKKGFLPTIQINPFYDHIFFPSELLSHPATCFSLWKNCQKWLEQRTKGLQALKGRDCTRLNSITSFIMQIPLPLGFRLPCVIKWRLSG